MTKRKIPDRPCVMLLAYHEPGTRPCKHCGTPTTIKIESWVNVDYRMELEARGINTEYASQLALAASIRHQQQPNSKPHDTAYLCERHLLEATRRALNEVDISLIRFYYDKFTPDMKYIVFDKNEEDERTAPKLTVGPYRDIKHFLEVYDELG